MLHRLCSAFRKVSTAFCKVSTAGTTTSAYGQNVQLRKTDFASDEGLWGLYERWYRHYGKLMTPNEKKYRFNIFKEEAYRIYVHNNSNPANRRQFMSPYADLTKEEMDVKCPLHEIEFKDLWMKLCYREGIRSRHFVNRNDAINCQNAPLAKGSFKEEAHHMYVHNNSNSANRQFLTKEELDSMCPPSHITNNMWIRQIFVATIENNCVQMYRQGHPPC